MIERINIEKLNMRYCDYIQVYLPDDYYKSSEKYDVIYMHDGHNLFDIKTSAYGMIWGIDKILRKRQKKYIIVGIECADMERYNLYSPWKYSFDNKNINDLFLNYGGKGDNYLTWIISKIIPMINQKYRINRFNTYMAGSSMGGLITLYAGLKYPIIFKSIGVFSPAIWFAKKELLNYLSKEVNSGSLIYMDIGHKETSNSLVLNFPNIYLNDTREVNAILAKYNLRKMYYYEDENGKHNEINWKKRFPFFLDFIEANQ